MGEGVKLKDVKLSIVLLIPDWMIELKHSTLEGSSLDPVSQGVLIPGRLILLPILR